MKYLIFITLGCLLLGPTFWKLSGSILSLVVRFFGGSFTRVGVYFTSNRHSFKYHVSTSLFMCKSKGRHLVISSLYHTYISFILSPFPYNTTYPSWFVTSYNCPPFLMVLVWSYHWWSRYPFVSVPKQEWTYSSPWYTLGYCRSYCFGKWNTCLKGSLPPFPSSHLMTNGYPYHQRRFSDLDGRCHCCFDLHIYGAMNIDNDDNTCSDDGCSRKDIIIQRSFGFYHACA